MKRNSARILSFVLLTFVTLLGPVFAGDPALVSTAAPPVAIDVDLPSDSIGVPGGTLALRIFAPSSAGDARYPDGAPVLIFVPGATSEGTLRPVLSRAEDVIRIVFLFPGGTDPLSGRSSDGTYDYRGATSIAALRDVIRYAAGELTDSLGRTIDDVVPVPVLHEDIGLLGSSNGGNIVVAVAAEHGAQLAGHLRYIVQWESPVSSQIATVDLGRVNLDCPPGQRESLPAANPRYQGYGPLTLDVDYSQLTYDAGDPLHPVFFDGTDDGRYTAVTDPRNGCQTPDLNLNGALELNEDFPLSTYSDGAKQYYSRPVTQALADQNVFGGSWPANIATPAEANAFWDLREAVRLYGDALTAIPNLEGIVLASLVDHVQTAPDHPHIHQAFDGWLSAALIHSPLRPPLRPPGPPKLGGTGDGEGESGWGGEGSPWIKINPARAYVLEVDPSLSGRTDLPDNAANNAPADWSDAGSYAYPEGLDEVYQAAAVHEMADRAHAATTLTPTNTPSPTATPSPTTTPTTPSAAACVSDVNANGMGDVADIQATASELPCRLYLPVVVANWRKPWPTPTSTATPTPTVTSTPTTGPDVPPLYFFYAIHTHVQGDWFPYSDPGMTNLDTQVADNMIAAIEDIAGVLEERGAKGTWEVVYGTSKGLCSFQGENHVFRQLLDSGHEVGIHAHRTEHIDDAFQNLQQFCGITSELTSGFMIEASDAGPAGAQEAVSQAIEQAIGLGMIVGTENLSPAGPRNPFGELCNNQIGVGNDMWAETGNLMFPWRPDYVNRNICADHPEGGMVFVDHVGPDWMTLPGQGKVDVLGDANFDQLREQFDAALAYMEENRLDRVAAWGFVSHINEYAVGDRGENPPEATALAALDRFLDYVDTKVAEGRVVYATAGEIAGLAFPEVDPGTPTPTPTPAGASLQTPHDVDRLPNGHTLITDGGQSGRQGEGVTGRQGDQRGADRSSREEAPSPLVPLSPCPGCGSRIIEVDEDGNVVWSFDRNLNWAHNADRLPDGHTLISNTGPNTVIEVDARGDVVWNSRDAALSDGSVLRYPNDANRLPNNHLLITDRDNHRVIEIERDGNIVWQFGETGVSGNDDSHLNGPHNADRLPDGNTIIADSLNNRIIEVAPAGTIVWEYKPTGPQALNWPRDADRLPNGNTLITDSRNGRIIEVTPAGQVVWEYAGLNLPYDADRLPNGNTLISGPIIEVDRDGNIIWQYPPADGPTPTPTPTPSAAYEPPINITFNIHFDPVLDNYQKWRERKDNLLWLKSFVEGYSGEYQPKLNIQAQGDHAEFYLDPTDPEAAEGREALADLYAAGHSFGTHAHDTLRGEDANSWVKVSGNPTAAEEVESWQDHIGYVEQLYAEIAGNSDPEFLREMNASAVMFLPKASTETQQAFTGVYSDPVSGEAVPHGFSVQTGGRNEHFYCLFDHDVQNPWRPGTQGALDEDLTNTAFVTVPQMPPLGHIGVHAHIPDCVQDNSVPSRQRMFIQEFLERLYREYTAAPDKVWTFGWHEHLFDIYPTGSGGPGKREFREEVEQMVDWLNERFISQTTANGSLVARYATVTEVRDEFKAWEASNPGVSSFELSQYTADWDSYPYELKGLARELANAHYDAALLPPDSTLQVYRFQRCPSSLRGETEGYWVDEGDGSFSCYDAPSERGQPAGNPLATTTVYVAWRDAADPEPTDLTLYAGDWATAYDGVTGTLLAADDALNAYPLDYRPIVILPGTPEPAPAGYLMISYNANYLWGPPVNVQQATADRFVPALNRHLDLMDRLGIRADYYFTGLAAEKLDEWSHGTVTRLLESPHGVHYHGANRPPYPQLVDQVLGEDWEQDVATARIYEAEGRNPATGEHVGGMAAFRDVFGQDPFATGRFFEASILHVDKEMGARMAVGLKDNTGASRDDAWFLGVLNRPTQAGLGASALVEAALQGHGDDYLSHARTILTGVSGPMPLVAFPIHDHDFFRHSPADQEKVWALYEQVLLLAQELGFQVVTMRDVYGMVQNGPAPTLTQAQLLDAAQSLVQTMEATGYPPEYVEGNTGTPANPGELRGTGRGSHEFLRVPPSSQVAPLTLAEAFEGLARALATYRPMGNLPASVETHSLLGPTAYFTNNVTLATVPADAVLDAAAAVSAALTDRLPSQVTVGSRTVNPAEFLYLMAQEIIAIVQGGPAPVNLHPINTLPLAVTQNQEADPLTRLQFWTYKPAVFAGAG